MRMKSMRCGYRVQNSRFRFPPGKSKSYYIIVGGSSMISRGLLFYADFTLTRKKGGKVHFFEKP